MRKDDDKRRSRYGIYRLIMVIALCMVAGRICSVTSREGDTAFLSANDRSRWCTVASLVEDGTYQIDRQISLTNEKRRRPWYTIDLVRHRGTDGQLHYYSSKPPLFPTMVAGVYWLVNRVTGLQMTQQPIYVPRMILLLVNIPLLWLFMWATIRTIDLTAVGTWSRTFCAAATCFGTMLTPFAISLNNHLPAAAAVALAVYLYFQIAERLDDTVTGEVLPISGWLWFIAGAAAAFTAANELPALSIMCLIGLLFLLLGIRGMPSFVAGITVVAVAFFMTNVLAHDSFRPPYAHRGNGDEILWMSTDALNPELVTNGLIDAGITKSDAQITENPVASGDVDRWVARSTNNFQYAIIKSQRKGGDGWAIHHWDDWYDYPKSYWRDGKRKGVDLGEPSRLVYLANMTIGHHGIFSISPIWCLLPFGMLVRWMHGPIDFRRFVWAVALASAVCFLFYLMRPEIDRNYGGVSSCFRWMLWFAPLWLVVIAPGVDEISESVKGRVVLLALLGASVFSMAISLNTPWQSPWIYRFWSFLGWIGQ